MAFTFNAIYWNQSQFIRKQNIEMDENEKKLSESTLELDEIKLELEFLLRIYDWDAGSNEMV